MVAVGAPADDVQVEVDLGRRERGDGCFARSGAAGRLAAQPPRSSGFAGAAAGAGLAGADDGGVGGKP